MSGAIRKVEKGRDIGFTFEEVGTETLPDGQKVPKFQGKPNDPEAHRKLIELIEQEEKQKA